MTGMPQTSELLTMHYHHLMQHRSGDSNDDLLAKMYASWLCGQGAMPLNLGLPLDIFHTMMDYHFPTLPQFYRPAQIARWMSNACQNSTTCAPCCTKAAASRHRWRAG